MNRICEAKNNNKNYKTNLKLFKSLFYLRNAPHSKEKICTSFGIYFFLQMYYNQISMIAIVWFKSGLH